MSSSLDGTPGHYLVTRVRNLRAHPVIVDLVFGAPDSADGDGHTPAEVHRLVLGAADEADCEKIVVPRLPRVGEIYIAGLERF